MPRGPLMLLVLAAIAMYAASRTLAEALGGDRRGGAIARGFGHSLPIAITAAVAVLSGHDALAVGVIFASSVMCLTLVAGVSLLSAPLLGDAEGRSAWPLVLPVAMLGLIAGVKGGVDLKLAGALVVLGIAIFWTWRAELARAVPVRRDFSTQRIVLAVLSIVLACVAAVAAIWAVEGLRTRVLTPGLAAATAVAPLLVLPLVGAASDRANRTRSAGPPLATALATAIINLCFWLPVVAVVHVWRAWHGGAMTTPALPVPLGVWRVDAVLMIAVGFALVPVGLARWNPGRLEGSALVGAYVLFLVFVAMAGWR